MIATLYEVEVIALDGLPNYKENLSFIKEPDNVDILSFLKLIRPTRRYSIGAIKCTYIGELDETGRLTN